MTKGWLKRALKQAKTDAKKYPQEMRERWMKDFPLNPIKTKQINNTIRKIILLLNQDNDYIDREVMDRKQLSVEEFDLVWDHLYDVYYKNHAIKKEIDFMTDERMYFIFEDTQFIWRQLNGIGTAFQFCLPDNSPHRDWRMTFDNKYAIILKK